MLLFVACFFAAITANAQAMRMQHSDTPIVPKKGIFGAGIKPPVIKIDKPQACIDSLYLYNKKIKRDYDSVRLYHPEVNTFGETYGMRTGCRIPVNIDFFKVAKRKKMRNGNTVWILEIEIPDATHTSVAFGKFQISDDATMYLYTEDRREILSNVANERNKNMRDTLWLPPLKSNKIIIEYAEFSRKRKTNSVLLLNEITVQYNTFATSSINQRSFCTVDANCNPSLLKEHTAIGKITSNFAGGGTGVLLNNLNADKKLYFLTARHVITTMTNAGANLSDIFVYFNYQSSSCNSTNNEVDILYPIDAIVAQSTSSDFMLLELHPQPIDDCKLTYSGWYNGTDLPFVGAGLHHPYDAATGQQEPLRISTYIGSQTNTFANTFVAPTGLIEPNKLWEVTYQQALVTNGSSGSPLFNEADKVVGQLIGGIGPEDCNEQIAAYGRFDAAWNGASPQTRLKDWLDPNNTGAIYTNTLYPWDLQMKDSNWANCDDGTEPNFNCTHGTGDEAWDDIWESPDLWNCQGSNDCAEPEAIKAGQTNRLRFTIRNPNNCTSDVPTVHLYWTVASTGEVWPEDWVHNNDNCMQGNEIATLSLPALAPNEVRTSSVNWTPPSLSNFSGCGSADINDLVGSKMEMCLLARLAPPSDPILREEENVPVTINILYNNNIVTRNTVLEGIQYNQPGQTSIIHLKNNNNFDTNLNLVIKGLVKVTPAEAQQLQIDIILTQAMWDRWTSTGAQGQGIQIVEAKLVRVTDLNTAKLLNIPMLANESRPFGVKITRLGNGKTDFLPAAYKFGITHEASDPHTTINKSSACIFDAHTKTSIPQNLSTTNLALLAYPNPSNGTLNLSFNLPQTEQSVNLSIYDLQGRLISTIFDNNNVESGVYNFETEIAPLTTGMYVAVLKTTNDQTNTKIIIINNK